jgi:Mg2+ and Co2+ transporter CorA
VVQRTAVFSCHALLEHQRLSEEGAVEIRLITSNETRPLLAQAIPEVLSRDEGTIWVDLDHTDEEGMALIPELIDVQPADLQECYTRSPVPKMHFYAGHYFSAINGLARGNDGRLYFQPLKVFITPRVLITVLGPTSSALTPATARRELSALRKRLEADGSHPMTALELISAIRYDMMQTQEELITSSAARIVELEGEVTQRDPVKAEALLDDLFDLRHDLEAIRTSAAQAHESYTNLIETVGLQEGLMQIDLRRVGELRQGFRHLQNTADLEREYLEEMIDLFQTRVSTELNRFVRKVTAWGSIAIAWTVIVGLYGMNFTHMPELSWKWGYPAVLGLMATVGIVLVTLFRRRGWL